MHGQACKYFRLKCAVAILLRKQSECMEKRGIKKTWNEKEVRDGVENFKLGNVFHHECASCHCQL
jgi:broad-specificity NMP kinase